MDNGGPNLQLIGQYIYLILNPEQDPFLLLKINGVSSTLLKAFKMGFQETLSLQSIFVFEAN